MSIAHQLIPKDGSALAEFKPQRTKKKDAQADAIISLAQRLHDWPLLEDAVEKKVEEQAEFVGWWHGAVTPNKGGDRKSKNQSPRPATLVADAEKQTGITKQQVSKWAKRLENRDAYREALYGTAYRAAMAEVHNHRAQGTGENEWYTPGEYLDAARLVLGEIDLDPASSDAAQEKVQAARYFTKENNGLTYDWSGRVWLNPPYTQPDIALFASKMVAERRAGRVSAAVMLTHNYTDTAWFHELAGSADAICFTRGRIKFYDATGVVAAPTQGQAFFYFGDDTSAFVQAFAEVGFCVLPWTGEV